MKTTKRFDNAVTKLYNAFHNGELIMTDCSKCAVGNICDGNYLWTGARNLMTKMPIVMPYKRGLEVVIKTGYSVLEIIEIECLFMSGYRSHQFLNKAVSYYREGNKEDQFKGLEAVIKYLCELDGIDNVMDYTKVFDYNEEGAVNELKEVI